MGMKHERFSRDSRGNLSGFGEGEGTAGLA